ncbi:MAG TPA: GNAT family N-acetyltransferase [Acetobacteraceae bacterium]|nr:GNAT family N-acetyltransferase [Acetobacteraceae bacterium]
MPTIRDAAEADLPGILAITNDEILHGTALWSLTPTTLEARRAWLVERQGRGFPVLVAAAEEKVLGYASFGPFRPFEGFRHTVEHSLYLVPEARGQGLGMALLSALMERARGSGVHVMVAGIDGNNAASLALHRRAGFEETGRLREVGRKFDRWLDLVFMQKMLGVKT